LKQVIYTSIVGNYDNLLAPAVVEPQFEYVAFCDETDKPIPPPWQSRSLLSRERNARMTARWHKLHPHLLFPGHDLSVYVDGNVRIDAPLSALVDQMSSTSPMALFRHAERDCIYTEAEIVKRYRLDDSAIVDAQMAYYRALGYPPVASTSARCKSGGTATQGSGPPGGDVYILKSVIHDWDRERSLRILQNCRRAMPPNARLLVIEPIVPERFGTSSTDQAIARSDLTMLIAHAGQERTEGEFRELLGASDLEVSRLLAVGDGFTIIEALPGE
jgi:hypothetical protein